ncbi:MAG TPA: MFS transporter [Acidimicrobiales bacterium]|nr:MFS transporter [Acidimicrobiales bacterium]
MTEVPDDRPPPDGRSPYGALSVEAPGADEVGVVPWPLMFRRRLLDRAESSGYYPTIVLVTVLYGLFSVGFTITILSVSIPTIADEFGASTSLVTWVVTGPILAFAIVGPSMGKVGDLYGHRRVYVYSMAGACVFAGLTALSFNAPSLILFRVTGAAVGAALGPASLAIINRMFPPHKRVQAMGYWSMVAAGGPVLGVVAGGPIVEAFGWRWIFIAQVPLTLGGVIIASAVLPDTRPQGDPVFDIKGALTLGLGVTSALVAVNRGPEIGWSSPLVIAGFVLSPVLLATFVAIERRVTHPLFNLGYLRRRNFAFAIGTQWFTNFAYMGGFIITPLLLQDVFGYSETKTGALLISRPLAFAIAGPLAGWFALRIGERTSAVVGAFAISCSLVALSTLDAGSSDLIVIFGLALSGVGLGMSAPSLAASIANAVDEKDLGVAGATQQMVSQFGVVVGITVMQTVQTSRAAAVGVTASYGDAYLVGAFMAAIGMIAAAFVISTPRGERGVERIEASDREPVPTG